MTPHADRDRSEPRGWSDDQPQPVEGTYGDAITSLVGAAKAEAQVARERTELRAEVERLRLVLASETYREEGGRILIDQMQRVEGERDRARDLAAHLEAQLARMGDWIHDYVARSIAEADQ